MAALDILYQDKITLFNRCVREDESVVWYPTVIDGVHLILDRAKIVAMYGESASDNAMVNIRYSGNRFSPFVAGKPFLSPKEFRKLPWYEAENYITFAFGEDFDFIASGMNDGIVENGNFVADDVYLSFGGFFGYMNKNYDNVFAITGFSQYNLIPHFSITAR